MTVLLLLVDGTMSPGAVEGGDAATISALENLDKTSVNYSKSG